jgi:3-hydroxypropanoate dehydrogenase
MTATTTRLALAPEAQDLLFRNAHSVSAFSTEPVDLEVIREVYDLVRLGPTALNSQPLRVLVLMAGQARQRLVACMSRGNQAKTAAAPLAAVLAADTGFARRLPELFPHKPETHGWFAAEPDRHRHAHFNATLQSGYFLIGLRAAGLAAGPMAGFDSAAVDREFFPDGRLRSLLVVNIGYPLPGVPPLRLPRLPYEEAVATL